jgi:hypothetical protein
MTKPKQKTPADKAEEEITKRKRTEQRMRGGPGYAGGGRAMRGYGKAYMKGGRVK